MQSEAQNSEICNPQVSQVGPTVTLKEEEYFIYAILKIIIKCLSIYLSIFAYLF